MSQKREGVKEAIVQRTTTSAHVQVLDLLFILFAIQAMIQKWTK
jgi:hypothetical protein